VATHEHHASTQAHVLRLGDTVLFIASSRSTADQYLPHADNHPTSACVAHSACAAQDASRVFNLRKPRKSFRLLLAKTGSRCVKLSLGFRSACWEVAPSLALQRARSIFLARLQLGLTLGDLDEKREHLPKKNGADTDIHSCQL
jgi:hypothetical protein